ncbi:MAG: DUF4157 domain-containing protein [Cyanobacteria bacterium P01_G01_bin.54]
MKERVQTQQENPTPEKDTNAPFLACPQRVASKAHAGENVPAVGMNDGRTALQLLVGSSWLSRAIAQRQAEKQPANQAGLPDRLKTGIERLSGYNLSDVRVNYNSPKPAQVNALAYTQGTAIEVAPRQERHLPHEAWRVVQQMQGRVREQFKVDEVGVNGDRGLEREVDVMGRRAVRSGG